MHSLKGLREPDSLPGACCPGNYNIQICVLL